MTNAQIRDFCLSLIKSDNEDEVVKLLTDARYWEDHKAWRPYGDNDNNFSVIGAQQSSPDAALVEKFVNSIDHRLINECLIRGIDPEGPKAPTSIREAVASFLEENAKSESTNAGRVSNWPNKKRTEVARGITLAATGYTPKKGRPCFTISDCGEGQTPDNFPSTLLSLMSGKGNKVRIPFVQGKFNMGSTGVLQFCSSKHNLQLILSRRNPALVKGCSTSDAQWGFTVVRRESHGGRSTVFTYLAPLGADANHGRGGVLRFSADAMPIFPEGRDAYGRDAKWGTLIKLYEYAAAAGIYSNTHILRKDGLLARLDILLPDPALPIRLYECRTEYGGYEERSFENNLTGLAVRLEDDRGENLEEGFPSSCPISVEGQSMIATIYGFKKDKAETYRRNEGIIFVVNGQTHGHLEKVFFTRKAVGRLNYIADSILVMIDCSHVDNRMREDLFKNSRDRLSRHDIRFAVERQLEEMLKQHQGLHDLKEKRRNEEIQSRLQDEKPLEDVLRTLLQRSPTLASLFLKGQRATNPFKTAKVRSEEKEFQGKQHPTYFKFKGKDYGKHLERDCHINQHCRVTFETDAVNDYFSRTADPGAFALYLVAGEHRMPVSDYVGPNLHNGVATLTVRLPTNCEVGDKLQFEAVVSNPVLLDPFMNVFSIEVLEAADAEPGSKGSTRKPPSDKKGDEREIEGGITLPHPIPVHEADWGKQSPPFDKYTTLQVKIDEARENGNGETHDVYDFYINMDNLFLKTELKAAGDEIELIRARWQYGLVLVGLALLHEDAKKSKTDEVKEEENGQTIEVQIESVTRALAPVLLPMIDALGALEVENVLAATASGEAV
jgi:hypothetical protein